MEQPTPEMLQQIIEQLEAQHLAYVETGNDEYFHFLHDELTKGQARAAA